MAKGKSKAKLTPKDTVLQKPPKAQPEQFLDAEPLDIKSIVNDEEIEALKDETEKPVEKKVIDKTKPMCLKCNGYNVHVHDRGAFCQDCNSTSIKI